MWLLQVMIILYITNNKAFSNIFNSGLTHWTTSLWFTLFSLLFPIQLSENRKHFLHTVTCVLVFYIFFCHKNNTCRHRAEYLADSELRIIGFPHGVIDEGSHHFSDLVQITGPGFLRLKGHRMRENDIEANVNTVGLIHSQYSNWFAYDF